MPLHVRRIFLRWRLTAIRGLLMSLYVRLECSFYRHRKTLRLQAVLKDDAKWVPPALWCWAAENQPDGDLSKYTAEEIAVLIGYNKDATRMLQALQTVGFVDENMHMHDWEEWNGYHSAWHERAKIAANARWSKEKEKQKEKREEKTGQEPSIATSMLQAKRETKKPYGEFQKVMLSDAEMAKLISAHGEAKVNAGIEVLDNAIASKGYKYLSHYATMKKGSWVWERVNGWKQPKPDGQRQQQDKPPTMFELKSRVEALQAQFKAAEHANPDLAFDLRRKIRDVTNQIATFGESAHAAS